jgi:hypothetical protein
MKPRLKWMLVIPAAIAVQIKIGTVGASGTSLRALCG